MYIFLILYKTYIGKIQLNQNYHLARRTVIKNNTREFD